jgi:hypothetical protein
MIRAAMTDVRLLSKSRPRYAPRVAILATALPFAGQSFAKTQAARPREMEVLSTTVAWRARDVGGRDDRLGVFVEAVETGEQISGHRTMC